MKKRNIIAIIVLILLCVACTIKKIDHNDTFYLIKIGEYISKNGIDLLDHFSWIPNLSYTYPHWLYSIFIYYIYNLWNFTGLYIVNMVIYIIFILSIYFICLRRYKDNFLAFFTSIICIMLLRPFIVSRAQSISIIFFLWEVYFISKLIETGKKKYIIYLTIDSLLIANIHGTVWLMFFILFLPFIGSHLIYLYFKKRKKKFKLDYQISIEQIDNIKLLLLSFTICFLMGLLTPSRICYTYILKTVLGTSLDYIQEHAPLIIRNTPIIIVTLFLLYFSKTKVKMHEFLMISGLLLMSLVSSRHLIFLYSTGFIYLAGILKQELDVRNDLTFSYLNKKLLDSKIGSIMTITVSVIICCITLYINSNVKYINEIEYPVGAVKYIKEKLPYQDIKLYNNYDFGSFLIFNDVKVFIDSRADLYMKEFGNQDVFEDFVNIFQRYNYETEFDKYDVQYALLYYSEPLNHIIKKDKSYESIYQDGYFVLYKKREKDEA